MSLNGRITPELVEQLALEACPDGYDFLDSAGRERLLKFAELVAHCDEVADFYSSLHAGAL